MQHPETPSNGSLNYSVSHLYNKETNNSIIQNAYCEDSFCSCQTPVMSLRNGNHWAQLGSNSETRNGLWYTQSQTLFSADALGPLTPPSHELVILTSNFEVFWYYKNCKGNCLNNYYFWLHLFKELFYNHTPKCSPNSTLKERAQIFFSCT